MTAHRQHRLTTPMTTPLTIPKYIGCCHRQHLRQPYFCFVVEKYRSMVVCGSLIVVQWNETLRLLVRYEPNPPTLLQDLHLNDCPVKGCLQMSELSKYGHRSSFWTCRSENIMIYICCIWHRIMWFLGVVYLHSSWDCENQNVCLHKLSTIVSTPTSTFPREWCRPVRQGCACHRSPAQVDFQCKWRFQLLQFLGQFLP